jgi:hypothetical protein
MFNYMKKFIICHETSPPTPLLIKERGDFDFLMVFVSAWIIYWINICFIILINFTCCHETSPPTPLLIKERGECQVRGTMALICSKFKTMANSSSVINPRSNTICLRDLPVSKDSLATAAAFKYPI